MKIGFIGLGIMGSRMVANLLKGGHELIVYNRTQSKAEALVQKGAILAESVTDLAEQVDVVFTMLENPAVVEKMALGKSGFLAAMKENTIWVDTSTVNPSFSIKMAEQAKEYGIHFLDAPVSGSKQPAKEASLLFLVGGEKKVFTEVQPLFDLMGQKAVHLGEHGKGSAMKLMINQQLGQAVLAFSESVSLGIAMGFDKKTAIEVLLNTPVTAPILDVFRSRFEENDFEANFPLKHLQKDLQLFTDTAYENGIASPLTNTAKEVYALAKQKGQGDLDFTSVFQFLNEQS